VVIREHYFAAEPFAAGREACIILYADREFSNKRMHRLVTTFRDTPSVCPRQVLIERQNSCNYGGGCPEVDKLQQEDAAARIEHWHLFRCFVRE
jgi:hypothetical protein